MGEIETKIIIFVLLQTNNLWACDKVMWEKAHTVGWVTPPNKALVLLNGFAHQVLIAFDSDPSACSRMSTIRLVDL